MSLIALKTKIRLARFVWGALCRKACCWEECNQLLQIFGPLNGFKFFSQLCSCSTGYWRYQGCGGECSEGERTIFLLGTCLSISVLSILLCPMLKIQRSHTAPASDICIGYPTFPPERVFKWSLGLHTWMSCSKQSSSSWGRLKTSASRDSP